MKKLLLLGTVLATTILGVNAQSPYGTQVGLTYYDLPSNVSGVNRVVYNEDDQSVSVTWIQSITALAQPTFERGAGYNHMSGGVWQHGTTGACRVNNACTQEYSGWPEIMNFPKQDVVLGGVTYPDVSTEVILAHSGGLKTISRGYRNSGAWTLKKLLVDQDYCDVGASGVWPRAVSQGTQYIHAIATQVGEDLAAELRCGVHSNVDRPFVYYRSSDQGKTWDIQNKILTGLEDTTFYHRGRGDEYAIAANGDVVAVVAGGNDEPWVMWKSRDKGLTWDYTIIVDWDPKVYFQAEFFGTGEHGKYTSDGSHGVVIDDDGTVHCFTGVVINAVDPVTGEWAGQATFGNSGIWYWNDNMVDFCEPAFIADLVDYGSLDAQDNFVYHAGGPKYASSDLDWDPLDGMATENGGYFASQTTMPSASVDASGNIYVTYSADVEGTAYGASTPADPAAIPFKDIYMVWSNDGGVTWSKELSLASDIAQYDDGTGGSGIEEDVFPTVAHHVGSDNILHVMWNMDYKPGSDVRDDNGEFSQQYLSYYGVDVSALTFVAGVTVTATPNTITVLADTAMAAGNTYTVEITDGYYGVMSPATPYLVPDTIWCIDCDTTGTEVDTVWCIGCGAGSTDTIVSIDTSFIDTVASIGSMDMNADADTIFMIDTDVSGIYTFTAMYGNACPDPSTTFTLTSTGGAITAMIMEDDSMEICAGESVTLNGVAGGGSGSYSLLWTGGATTSSITVTPSATTTYVFDVDGGTAQDSVTVIVNALPAAGGAGADANLTIELQANNTCSTPFLVLGDGSSAVSGMSYLWTPAVGMTADDAMTYDPTILPTTTTTYKLTTTDDATGCKSTDEILVTVSGSCTPVGVQEELKFELSVYPNPTSDVLNVEVGDATIKAVTIYNNLGAIVAKEFANGATMHSVNTSNYTPGIYYVYIQTDKGDTTKQFTVVE